MGGALLMDWWRSYHGAPTDPKLRVVARLAGNGATPGHVAAIWWALLDQASQSRPRGAITGLDVAAIAAAFDWDQGLIQAILDALAVRRHIVDGRVRQWIERNPEKQDATAAERQRRHRAKKPPTKAKEAADERESNATSRRDTRDGHTVTPVTPLEEKERSSFSDSLRQETNSTLKLDTPRSTRALNASSFWQHVQAMGLQAHIGIRTVTAPKLRGWLTAGLTEQQLTTAYEMALARRNAARDSRPVNLGFLGCLIDQVLEAPANSPTTGGAYARGDDLSRSFASR